MASNLNPEQFIQLNNWLTAAQQSHRNGDTRQTVELCHNILSLQTGNPIAHKLLGLIAYQSRQFPEATEHFKAAIRSQPDDFSHYGNLGLVYMALGEDEHALQQFHQVLKLNPQAYKAHHNIGLLLSRTGKFREAVTHFCAALELNPDKAGEANSDSISLWEAAAQKCFDSGDLPQTAELCQEILKIKKNNPTAHNLLGLIAYRSRHPSDAIEHFKTALTTQPNDSSLYNNLGLVYAAIGNTQAAIQHFNKTLELNPKSHKAHQHIGSALNRAGRLHDALAHFLIAAKLDPDTNGDAQTNVLFLQAAYCLCPSDELLRQHREWDTRQRAGKAIEPWSTVSDPDPERRLRIGYVSADFHQHPVARFMEPLLTAHDHSQVEIFCYGEEVQHDAVTDRLQSLSDHWRNTKGMSDDELARRIRQDKIDILVDLGGHTGHNRLSVFTLRPAPIQATYLGYCASTGLDAMDYWISDSVLHPADTSECASESIYRLPRCWVSFQPPEDAPAVSQREADPNHITFGSLNNVHKMSEELYKTWADILLRLPGSRLLLKSKYLGVEGVPEELLKKFATLGIEASRIELQTKTPPPDYLAVYDKIDIALDTFPRTGGTTAADALWMGVPVITLAGDRYVERLVASKLETIGRPEWVATSTQDYIEKTVDLAENTALLKELRATQRQQLEQSPLCDGKGLANVMEQAYRDMWQSFLKNIE